MFGNIFIGLGAIALLVGILVFVHFQFSLIGKIITSFLAGTALMGVSLKLHYDKFEKFSNFLMGTGLGILFITTFFCVNLDVFEANIGFAIALFLLVSTVFVSSKFDAASTFIIGLLGTYLSPIFIRQNTFTPEIFFSYFLIVNFVSLIYVAKNPEKAWLNIVNLILTSVFIYVAAFWFSIGNSFKDTLCPSYITAMILLWTQYFIFDYINGLKDTTDDFIIPISGAFNLGILTLLSYGITKISDTVDIRIFALVLSFCAFAYLISAFSYVDKSENLYRYYFNLFLTSILIATFFAFKMELRMLAWYFEGIILALYMSLKQEKFFGSWLAIFYIFGVCAMFMVPNLIIISDVANYTPIFNLHTFYFVLAMVAPVSCILLQATNKNFKDIGILTFLRFCALTFAYLWLALECAGAIEKYCIDETTMQGVYSSALVVKLSIYSIIAFFYSLNLYQLSTALEIETYKHASYFAYFIAFMFLIIPFWMTFTPYRTALPFINMLFLSLIVGVISSYIFYLFTKENVFKFAAMAIGLIMISSETHNILAQLNETGMLWYSVPWILYAMILSFWGIQKDEAPAKIMGNITIALSVFFIIIGFMNAEIMEKFISCGLLGISLMGISYFYIKKKE